MKILHYSNKEYTVSFYGTSSTPYDSQDTSLSSLPMRVDYNGKISGVFRGFLSQGSSKILKLKDGYLVIETIDGDKKYTRTFEK